MIKIGITGSISSGKTTASKFISKKRGALFSADKVVKKLYKEKKFQQILKKRLKINSKLNLKKEIKKNISKNNKYLKIIEKIIHPLVRKEMSVFLKKNKKNKFLFLEIPLLIESKLIRHFDVLIFIKSKKNLRLRRYLSNGGTKKLFVILDKQQLKDTKKMKYCDHVVVNNTSLSILKRKLLNIIKKYE